MAAAATVWYSIGLCYIVGNERILSTTIRDKNRGLACVIVGDRWGVYNDFNSQTCWLCSV